MGSVAECGGVEDEDVVGSGGSEDDGGGVHGLDVGPGIGRSDSTTYYLLLTIY